MGAAWSALEENDLWKKSPKWVKFGLANFAAHVLCFWGSNGLLYLIHKAKLFEQHKIQQGVFPPAALVMEAMKSDATFDFILAPLTAWPFYKGMTFGGDTKTSAEEESKEKEAQKEGWSYLHFRKQLPSWFTQFWQVLVAYLGYDLMFYLSHRALHSKLLYKRFHKQHHQFTSPIGIASSHQSPFEGIIQMPFNWFIPLGFAGWLNGGLHISTVFLYNCFRWFETVDAHCGYSFPWSPFSIIPLFGGALAHDFHHSGDGLQMKRMPDGTLFADFGNYGASIIWDTLLGTISPAYREMVRKFRRRGMKS